MAFTAACPNPTPNLIPGPAWNDIIQDIIIEDEQLETAQMAAFVVDILPELLPTSGESSSYDEHESTPQLASRVPVTSAPVPAPRYDLLSRKRARSPSRELTPCPGPNREPFAHAMKRPRIDLPPTPSSSAETTGETRGARMAAAVERYQTNVRIAMGELGPDGNPHDYHKALNEIRTRFAGRVTEREVGLMARKFQEHPKMPVAYLAWPEHQKEWLFKLMIRDQAEVERKRMQARIAQKPQWESVLRTHHIKEIDERPRGTNRDRVKLWLANVTTPF